MLTRTIMEGPSGEKLEEKGPETFDAEGAKLAISILLEEGFKPITSNENRLVLEKHSGGEADEFRYVEYQTFTGPIREMKSLIAIAGPVKTEDIVPA